MSTLRAGDREFHTLPAGHVLTVVAAAASAGLVRQYPDSGFNALSPATAVGAGATVTVGPFTGSVRLGVEATTGTVTWEAGPAEPASDLSATQTAAAQALVSGAGIRGIGGQTFSYDGDALPDPRLQTTVSFVAAGDAETTDYLQNGYGLRRIVIALASQTTNSAITESAGGQTLTVAPNAAAAGFRWVNSVTHPQNMTTQADSSVGIIDILGA